MHPPRTRPVLTDLTVRFSSSNTHEDVPALDPRKWHRVEKELYLHTSPQEAWLYAAIEDEEEIAPESLVVVAVRVGAEPPKSVDSAHTWEPRPGGIWVLQGYYFTNKNRLVTALEILFGADAVDPRPGWTLSPTPLQLKSPAESPAPRLSVLYGRASELHSDPPILRCGKNGKFKVVQISDTHMVTGPGICKDALDAAGNYLPPSAADPLTVKFIEEILDLETPDLVVLCGDQVHHDNLDTQSALFKVVAPIIQRRIPFAAVFGNHDSEGSQALSREVQMSILQSLPFSLCEPGPGQIDGVGNYFLNIVGPAPDTVPLSTLYFLDSHGQISSNVRNPDYDTIKESQIEWFRKCNQTQRKLREGATDGKHADISMVFQHIPLPEFRDRHLRIRNGHRREPSEGPSANSHFYHSLVKEGVSAFSCGHDHVNDFCALLPRQELHDDEMVTAAGPWLCYGGGSGFGGYCSYGRKRFHRRARVWQLDPSIGGMRTWKRVEYGADRVDEVGLIEDGITVDDYLAYHTDRQCALS